MKHLFSFVLSFVFALPVMAQPRIPTDKPQEPTILPLSESGEPTDFQQALLQLKRPMSDEQMINLVLDLPFELRQYIGPQLHESMYVTQKVRTHPDIIIWKGKKPTRIAPQLTEWAKEHLEYLPASFYPAVMPEMWPTPTTETNPKPKIMQLLSTGPLYTGTLSDPQSVLNKLDGPRIQISGGPLADTDIQRFGKTIRALDNFYNTQPDPLFFRSELLTALDPDLPTTRRIAFPFKTLIERLTKMGHRDAIETLLKKQGWADADDFANRADRLVKAYRANYLKPNLAIELYKIRQKYQPDTIDRNEQAQLMYASMYESTPEDIAFVAPHLKQLRRLLKNKGSIVAGTIVYLD